MSILAGLFPPTSGDARVYGHSVRTDMQEIRKSLGMCPQFDVLYMELTVEEQLRFYSRLKVRVGEGVWVCVFVVMTMHVRIFLPGHRYFLLFCLAEVICAPYNLVCVSR